MAPLSRLSTPEILEKLLNYRLETVRRPEEVVQLGEIVLERGWANSSSDEGTSAVPVSRGRPGS